MAIDFVPVTPSMRKNSMKCVPSSLGEAKTHPSFSDYCKDHFKSNEVLSKWTRFQNID